MGDGANHSAMLLLAAALVLSAAVASASDDPGGGGELEWDKRADGYAMAWRKGKRFSPALSDAVSPLYGARYVLAAPRQQPVR